MAAFTIAVELTRPDQIEDVAASLEDRVLSFRVDRSKPLPAYVQIAGGLREQLRCQAAPGQELPPERLLCQAYGVTRMTLRQALTVLEREGLIQRLRGKGTFVSQPGPEERTTSGEALLPGPVRNISIRLLSFRIGKPTPPAREFLGLRDDEWVYQIRRICFAGGTPFALEFVQVPLRLCPNLNEFDLVHENFDSILEKQYQFKLAECLEEISAVRPNRMQRRLLQTPRSAAILLVSGRKRLTNDLPAEFAVTAYRGDMYTAVVRSAVHGNNEATNEV